ncbi:MAG: bacteriohemerythrin [Proteobacteria bacterium]|nr:bacteriohemerythrin [Pseudomonadota bacterium]
MEWNDRYKLGHVRIDGDHMKLVALVNQLTEAMLKRKGQQVCGKVLDELVNYFNTHFAMEEQLMATHHYAKTIEHKAEHAKFVEEILAFKAEFEAGSVILSISLLNFLREWLINHILISDKALVAGIKADSE